MHVSLEPLVPGVTDSRENLMAVFEALAAARVRHVTAGYLSLSPAAGRVLSGCSINTTSVTSFYGSMKAALSFGGASRPRPGTCPSLAVSAATQR